jgi:hypothetical protein
MGILEDFIAIGEIIDALTGDAGTQGQICISQLSSSMGMTIERLEDMDLSLLDDETTLEMLRVLE